MAEQDYQLGPYRFRIPRRDYLGWAFRRQGEARDVFGLSVGTYPGRKKVALYADAGPVSIPLAYFRSPLHAQLAMVLLNTLILRQEPEPVQAGETTS